MERLLTLKELAAHLQKPEATLYMWRYRGEGPAAIKIGRDLRYRESVVEAWLEANTSGSTHA